MAPRSAWEKATSGGYTISISGPAYTGINRQIQRYEPEGYVHTDINVKVAYHARIVSLIWKRSNKEELGSGVLQSFCPALKARKGADGTGGFDSRVSPFVWLARVPLRLQDFVLNLLHVERRRRMSSERKPKTHQTGSELYAYGARGTGAHGVAGRGSRLLGQRTSTEQTRHGHCWQQLLCFFKASGGHRPQAPGASLLSIPAAHDWSACKQSSPGPMCNDVQPWMVLSVQAAATKRASHDNNGFHFPLYTPRRPRRLNVVVP